MHCAVCRYGDRFLILLQIFSIYSQDIEPPRKWGKWFSFSNPTLTKFFLQVKEKYALVSDLLTLYLKDVLVKANLRYLNEAVATIQATTVWKWIHLANAYFVKDSVWDLLDLPLQKKSHYMSWWLKGCSVLLQLSFLIFGVHQTKYIWNP